jgi:hypothetical protein
MDSMCISEGVQKIETVGKTYLAACGLKDVPIEDKDSSTEKILHLAQVIMLYIQSEYSSGQALFRNRFYSP